MSAVILPRIGWLNATADARPHNRNRVTLRTCRGVKLTLNAGNVKIPTRRNEMVETKRMRSEHLHDEGAATDTNPRTHAPEKMPPDVLRSFRAAQDAVRRGDESLMESFDEEHPEYSLQGGAAESQPFGATTQKPAAGTQPPNVRASVLGKPDTSGETH